MILGLPDRSEPPKINLISYRFLQCRPLILSKSLSFCITITLVENFVLIAFNNDTYCVYK